MTEKRYQRRGGVDVPAHHVQWERDNYAIDRKRGKIVSSMNFTDYVTRYCGWKVVENQQEEKVNE